MRSGMQDPIITLRNMLSNPTITDAKSPPNDVVIHTYWSEEMLKKATQAEVWVAIGHPSGATPRDTWISLPGMGYRMYRSWRYPIYIGGYDLESIYKVKAEIMKRVREQRASHSAPPEYIEFMYVETVFAGNTQFEEVIPPIIHFIIYVVVEFLEL